MDQYRPSMMNPPIEGLLDRVEFSKFALVTLTGRRAREVTTYFSQLGEGLGKIVPPQVSSLSRKPVSIALEEIYQCRIVPAHDAIRTPGGASGPLSERAAAPGEEMPSQPRPAEEQEDAERG